MKENTKRAKEKSNHCCVCTSTKDLEAYLGAKFRCKVCVKEARHPSSKK